VPGYGLDDGHSIPGRGRNFFLPPRSDPHIRLLLAASTSGCFRRWCWVVKLNAHLLLVRRWRMSWTLPSLPHNLHGVVLICVFMTWYLTKQRDNCISTFTCTQWCVGSLAIIDFTVLHLFICLEAAAAAVRTVRHATRSEDTSICELDLRARAPLTMTVKEKRIVCKMRMTSERW